MMNRIFQIDTDKCRPELQQALDDTVKLAKEMRSEFITPEHLFFVITNQKPFMHFCSGYGIYSLKLQKELADYLDKLDKSPNGEEYYCMLSSNLKNLMGKINDMYDTINLGVKKKNISKICVSDVLTLMNELDDSIAQYLIEKYLTNEMDNWEDALYDCYTHPAAEDDSPYAVDQDQEIEIEKVVDGKKVKMSREEMHGKLMASMGRLASALGALSGGQPSSISISTGVIPVGMIGVEGPMADMMSGMEQPHQKNSKKKEDKEPWEEMVTKIDDKFLRTKNSLIGRTKELDHAIRILCRKDKNNPLFIGEPGVGKTAMIYGLAQRFKEMALDSNTSAISSQLPTIYQMDMGDIIAGASFHGEYERRMKEIFEGAKAKGNCIIYIDEIHTVCQTGGSNSSSMSAVDLMKPYLEDGSIRFIGSTTYQAYNKYIAGNKAFSRRFGQIDIKEPSVEETIQILANILPSYEKHHRVRYDEEAVRYCVEQSHSLINDRFLPDKAIDILDEAGAYRQQEPLLNKKGEPKAPRFQKVDKTLVRRVLTEVCRIDAKALTEDSNEDLKDLDKRISADIYGQDEAVRQVVRSVMMSKAGLTEPDKPIASLLFVGPTGVGKTEVCKVLAHELGIQLIRFDMSEYTEKHTISKLIGSPAGYVGYDEGGLLTDAIRKTPNCVLLLDEIEKAHEDIYNILLQVMDYAKLTDNRGNKIDFKNVILVMTSNAGAQFAGQAGIGFGGGQSKGQAMLQTVKKTFKPEFINRLTGTVVFNEMDKKMASMILDKKLRQLSDRLKKKAVTMTLTQEAHDWLLEKGFTKQYGAREMDRAIQQNLTPLLMDEILFGKLKNGGNAKLRVDSGELRVNV